MIQIFTYCYQLKALLDLYIEQLEIKDFRIHLRTNEKLFVYVLIDKDIDRLELSNAIKAIYVNAQIEFVSMDYEDDFYNYIFAIKNRIVFDTGRRRLNSLLSSPNQRTQHTCPIVTFYSYKGGMGRSTTLASFAMYLALKEKKNIFIIDCDLEAPGFNNFFLKNPAETNQEQGLIEYVIDKQSGLASKEKLSLYCSEVGQEFSGDGCIRVMHAGNLDTSRKLNIEEGDSRLDLDDYVEGLSRLDLVNTQYALSIFDGLFDDICSLYSPDIILIDSKTGLSDVMGLTVCSLSDIVVGFFRNDTQSLPGLYYFIKTMVKNPNVDPYIVNSILPFSRERRTSLFEHFKSEVHHIIDDIEEDSDLDFPCFAIYRNEDLEVIGTSAENVNDLAAVILNDEYRPYKELFESLSLGISQKTNNQNAKADANRMLSTGVGIIDKSCATQFKTDYSTIDQMSDGERKTLMICCKNYILDNTYNAIAAVDLYADNVSIANEIKEKRFFYRSCMSDLFNPDKYMILGSKGTGKSYLYSTLKSQEGVDYLQKRSGHSGDNVFIYTIDKISRIFHVYMLPATLSKNDIYRFWLIYSWNSIIEDIKQKYPDFTFSDNLETFPILDNQTTTSKIEDCIRDSGYVQKIEMELQRLDNYLSSRSVDSSLTIVYDQLDEIVNPKDWNQWIPELIDIWRNKKYVNICGKLFVRKDLFRSLVGLTNKKDIENKAIDIEWSKEEIYSYFFKVIFSGFDKEALWTYMYLAGYDKILIKQCKSDYLRGKEQFRMDDYILRHLVDTFFGKQVDTGDSLRMGTSYDWFYKNLKNADDSISLRPYIELLKQAMQLRAQGIYSEEETIFPVLYQKYYTNREVRKEAVKRHYQDLVEGAIGNKPIEYIFEFISNHGKYKYVSMNKSKFEDMLADTLRYNQDKDEMNDITVEQLKSLLITNGIVKEDNFGRGTVYVFSFLYKYMLGLRKA